jgi:hypothetical protein
MFISIPIRDVNVKNICFDEKRDNTIMSNSDFYMIHYRAPFFGMHNLVASVDVSGLRAESAFHKRKFSFHSAGKARDLARRLTLLEQAVLGHFHRSALSRRTNATTPKPTIAASVSGGAFYTKHVIGPGADRIQRLRDGEVADIGEARVYLKMSGVWMSGAEYGLIYKLVVRVNSQGNALPLTP